MRKIVEVESCSECPKAMFVETRDPAIPRVYVGCGLSHRSFDYEFMNANPMPIQPWCELPDAQEERLLEKFNPVREVLGK